MEPRLETVEHLFKRQKRDVLEKYLPACCRKVAVSDILTIHSV